MQTHILIMYDTYFNFLRQIMSFYYTLNNKYIDSLISSIKCIDNTVSFTRSIL